MRRFAHVPLYSVLALVLVAALGAAALAFSADPRQFVPTNLPWETPLDQEAELLGLSTGGADELRLRYVSFTGWDPAEAGVIRVTSGRIEKYGFADGSWGRRLAVVSHASEDTPTADQILALIDALRNEPPQQDDGCISHGQGMISGLRRGEVFARRSIGCTTSPVEQQVWDLIRSVPASQKW